VIKECFGILQFIVVLVYLIKASVASSKKLSFYLRNNISMIIVKDFKLFTLHAFLEVNNQY
jgi:hypothetical protein